MIDKLKTMGIYILAAIVAIFGGYGYIQKKRADRKDEKIDELENEMQANDINNEVKNFEAINRERKDVADAKLDKELDDLDRKLNGNTTHRV